MAGALCAAAALFLKPALRLTSLALHRLELRAKYTERGYPKNYVAIASKAAVEAPVAARA